ncbi:hypothetical protein [Pedobacter sp.]|jgi:hypothetical protein|uniref:hypothetical protein n=1 Tax=Pedobacter sp. TaxID=1411316 RepID=UPI002CC64692|nr:hypothetical protein [Pedobacter sp.]HWW38061.1 hypothetical protein [Pedobacter sp.]
MNKWMIYIFYSALRTAANIQKETSRYQNHWHPQVLTDNTQARANQAKKGCSVYFNSKCKKVTEMRNVHNKVL